MVLRMRKQNFQNAASLGAVLAISVYKVRTDGCLSSITWGSLSVTKYFRMYLID